jgi:Flp pilus assembly protein TadG
MMRVRKLLSDIRGSAAVEFAVAVPVLIIMIWGIFQVAIVLQAQAGVEQALGEGARYATIFNTTTNARPTNTQISTKIVNAKFGIRNGTWHTPAIDTTNEAAGGYINITVQYDVPTNFLVFPGPTIALTKSKRVYIQKA